MKRLDIFTDHKAIFGFEVVYLNPEDFSDLIVGAHVGSNANEHTHRESVVFEPHEFIDSFHIRSGDWVDAVHFTTNYGKEFKFGGTGGEHRDMLDKSEQKRIVAIGGGLGGHMHNFTVYYI